MHYKDKLYSFYIFIFKLALSYGLNTYYKIKQIKLNIYIFSTEYAKEKVFSTRHY